MKGDDIAERLLDFSAQILALTAALPPTAVGKRVGRQLLRAGRSGGANDEEARCAESRADRWPWPPRCPPPRTRSWWRRKSCAASPSTRRRLIERARLSRQAHLTALVTEGNELLAIQEASARTARERAA